MFGLDLSFYNWDVISKFVLQGLWFSLELTLVATIGSKGFFARQTHQRQHGTQGNAANRGYQREL